MTKVIDKLRSFSRRSFLSNTAAGMGAMALGNLFSADSALNNPTFPAKAKRVIYLFQSGGPSQLETFDYKPELKKWHGQEIPPSIRKSQRNSGMVADQSSFPLVQSIYNFNQHGSSGAWVCDLFPHTAQIVDDLCIVNSMYTEAINHEPAMLFMQTGSQLQGRPSMGSWLSYGLGSSNSNLPAFVVMISKGGGAQPLNSGAWGSGFLPSHHQGVQFRSGADPVLYLSNPPGVDPGDRRRTLDFVAQLDHMSDWSDPAVVSKIKQYEMAFHMQAAVPDVVDLSKEPEHIYKLYGDDARKPGTYAANCLLARKLIEQDVRFVQLYHMGWDHHGGLPGGMKSQALQTDQASAALIKDLKQRGLLDDTLVIWGGEFGRTSFSQGKLTATNYGRDHHPGCFSMWMAGGGIKAGQVWGETDSLGYNIARDGVHIHDFQATMLHLLGIDHEQLTYKYQGRRFRLTDVHGHVVHDLLA